MDAFEAELGQYVFSNTPWQPFAMQPMVESGLIGLGALVAGDEWDANPCINAGAIFENEIFALRAYCWCDGGAEGHEDGCPPNFEYGDFTACWYKHVSRGNSQNREVSREEWRRIMAACVASLAGSEA